MHGELLKWWRGAPAKGVGRVTGARVQISHSPPTKKTEKSRFFSLFLRSKNRFDPIFDPTHDFTVVIQVAHAAVKVNDNSYYRLKYEQISKRRGKKRAIIAISRMILTAIFQMMTTGEVWNPSDLYKVDMPESLKERQLSKAVKQATKFLEKQGLTVS